jgi:glycosyltransferase involved in cell wall biosynthesis
MVLPKPTMENRRCLIIVTGALHSDGGVAAVNRLVIHSLIEEGYQIDIFALYEDDDVVDGPSEWKKQLGYRTYHGNKLLFSLAVWKAWFQDKYDLVFSDHINLALVFIPLRIFFRQPYMVWVHGFECFPPNPNWEGFLGLRFSSKCLTSSDHTRDVLLMRYPYLSVITCDLALDPLRRTASLPPEPPTPSNQGLELKAVSGAKRFLGKKVILLVGRLDSSQRNKGQDVLIQALPLVKKQHPDAQLVLVGQGDDRARLETLANSYPTNIRESIFITGFASDEDLSNLYRICYLFAMPSRGEGFGIVYLEAMCWAKPCVGSKLDGAKCVIQDGRTGLLVDDPSSPKEVAEKIICLLSHPEEAIRMGVAGYNLVGERYLFPSFKRRFLSALSSL